MLARFVFDAIFSNKLGNDIVASSQLWWYYHVITEKRNYINTAQLVQHEQLVIVHTKENAGAQKWIVHKQRDLRTSRGKQKHSIQMARSRAY